MAGFTTNQTAMRLQWLGYSLPPDRPFTNLAPAPTVQYELVRVRIVRPTFVDGACIGPGELVQLDSYTAGDLVARGRAEFL